MLSAHLAEKTQSAINNCCATAPADGCLIQVWTPETNEDGVSLLRTKGRPFVCWGSDERAARFRCLSCEAGLPLGVAPQQDIVAAASASGAAVAGPSKPAASPTDASREAHLSRCNMTVALALPLYEHVDRQQLIGALEVARMESQPAPSYAFLSSLATCLQDAGIYTSDVKKVLISSTKALAPPEAAKAETSAPTTTAGHDQTAADSAVHAAPAPGGADGRGDALAVVELEAALSPAVKVANSAGAAAMDVLLHKAGSPRSSRSASTTGVVHSEDIETSNSSSGSGSGFALQPIGGNEDNEDLSSGILVHAASGALIDVPSGAGSGAATSTPPSESAAPHVSAAMPDALQLLPPSVGWQAQPPPPPPPPPLARQRPTAQVLPAAGGDPGDLAALPGLNDAQRLMFSAFAPAYNPEMKQKARSLAAKRAAAEGLAPTRQAPPMAAAAAAARPALKAPGSRKQLKRPFKNERPQARRQQQRPQTSRRANAAGPSQPEQRYSEAPMFAPATAMTGVWVRLAASSTSFTPGHLPLLDAPLSFYNAQPPVDSHLQGSFEQHEVQDIFQMFATGPPTSTPSEHAATGVSALLPLPSHQHLMRGPPPALPQHPPPQVPGFEHMVMTNTPVSSSADTYGSGYLDSLLSHQDDHLDAALLEGLDFDLDISAPEFAAMASAMVH